MRTLKDTHVQYILFIVAVFLFFVGMFGYGIYRYQWKSPVIYKVSSIIPYPALLVDWELVPYKTYVDDYQTLSRYWAYQRDNMNVLLGIPSDELIREQLIEKLINEKIVAITARKNGITISHDELEAEWNRLQNKPEDTREIAQFIGDAYGWSEDRFKERVLTPFLLQQKVKAYLTQESNNSAEEVAQRALEVYGHVTAPDADFATIAKEVSEDTHTRSIGGDLGYFSRGSFEPQLEQVIFNMSVGEISEPVQSSFGYHIFMLDDLLFDDANVAQQASARHILLKTFDFNAWLAEQKESRAVYRLVR